MKRLLLSIGVLASITGMYLLYTNHLEADDDGPTATTTSGPIASGSAKQPAARSYQGPAITATIDGEEITLSPAAINLSSVLKNMLALYSDDEDSDDEDSDDDEDEAPDYSSTFKTFNITPMVADMLNAIGDLKLGNPTFSDAKIVVHYFKTDTPRPTENFEAMATTADVLNVELLWQVTAARYAHLLKAREVSLEHLANLAKTMGMKGWGFNGNPYSPFGAEVFRQYWLIFQEDARIKDTLLKNMSKEEKGHLEKISKRCFNTAKPWACLDEQLTPHAKATYPILIPTFFTFGVSIQEMLDHGRKLDRGKLSSMHIGSLEGLEKIKGLGRLSILYLANNQISSIPAKIEGLGSLSALDLIGNQITAIPKKIEGLESLRELYLNNNQINSIPAKIEGLESLWGLFLNNNQIKQLPAKIEGLGSLLGLWLIDNQISSIPKKIEGLGSLQRLELEGNPLTSKTIPANKWGLPAWVVIRIKQIGLDDLLAG